MWTPEIVAIVIFAFLCAGTVKGVIGLGIPTVSLGILAATLGLKDGMALMLVPSIVTNIWQGLVGGHFKIVARRLWTLLAAASVGSWFGTGLLAAADADVLIGLLGILLCIYSAISLLTPQIPPPGQHEIWMSPVAGGVTGVIMGMTGTFFIPGILYMQALGMPRDVLVQAMGVTFGIATVALGVSLAGHGLLTVDLGLMSATALAPAAVGMVIGQRLRKRLPENAFRRVFFSALTVLGLYIVARSFM